MMRQAMFLVILLGGISCSGESNPGAEADTALQAGLSASGHWKDLSFPIFSDDAEARYAKLRKQRKNKGLPETKLTDQIQWAKSLDEAFERGKAEDKPVLLVTFVRENGDPLCDV